MARTGWRLTRLISRLGIKGGDEFEIIPAVQPVLPIGTIGSGLTYPIYAAAAITGKFLLAPANNSLFELAALGDGGAIVESFAIGGTSAGGTPLTIRWRIGTTSTLGAGTALTNFPVGPDAPRSFASFEDAPAPAGDAYTVTADSGRSTYFPGPIHIPNGSFFSAWVATTTTASHFGVSFQDVTVQEPLE